MAVFYTEAFASGGEPVVIRSATGGDADQFLAYLDVVAGESDNLTFGAGQASRLFTDEVQLMQRYAEASNKVFLIAFSQGAVIGALTFSGSDLPKLSKGGSFGLSVLQAWWGRGIGSLLLRSVIEWARVAGMGKINLQVRTDNLRAISLYRKMGFVEEAVLRDAFSVDGVYIDLLWMGLKIGPDTDKDTPVAFSAAPRLAAASTAGHVYQVRDALVSDAMAIHNHLAAVSKETEFLSMGVEGPSLDVEQIGKAIDDATPLSRRLWAVAMAGPEAVGVLSCTCGKRDRTRHSGDFTLSVRRGYAGMGIGRALMEHLILWARSAGVHRLELEVRTENTVAVALYRSMGFEMEGRIGRTVWYGGGFHDSYQMGLLLD